MVVTDPRNWEKVEKNFVPLLVDLPVPKFSNTENYFDNDDATINNERNDKTLGILKRLV